MSRGVEIQLPDELCASLQREPEELAGEIRLAAAVKWYELGQLSQGKAAEVAGLTRAAFINELSRFNVSPFQETPGEIIDTLNESQK